jgi:hypothetical protein
MGIRSYIRDRIQVRASRAGNGAAAASELTAKYPRRNALDGPPSGRRLQDQPSNHQRPARPGPLPKKEDSPEEAAAKAKRRDLGYDPYTKDLYSSNKPEKKQPKQRTQGSFGDGPPTKWPEGDGDRRSPIDRI